MTRKEEFVADARRFTRAIWDNLAMLEALQREAVALDYTNTLGTQVGLDSADVLAMVVTTANAMRGLLNSGHATNMAKLL